MDLENVFFIFSAIVVSSLLLINGYKSYLHYLFLYRRHKIKHWKKFILFPLENLDHCFHINFPIFISSSENNNNEIKKIKKLVKAFWIVFLVYFLISLIFAGYLSIIF